MGLSSKRPPKVKYPNQPLIQVVTEVRFKGALSVEIKRANFQAQVGSKYPHLFVPVAVAGVAPQLQHYRFERDDQAAGTQVAVNSISYYERQYSGSASFIKEATRLIDIGTRLFGVKDLTRVGWRYINAIPFARESSLIPLNRFFKSPPILLSIDTCAFKNIGFRAVTDHEGLSVAIRLENDPSSQPSEVLLLDIDAYREDLSRSTLKTRNVKQLVDELHCVARNFFEDLITEEYRTYLTGEAYA